jgi:rod shape determining protein RodA
MGLILLQPDFGSMLVFLPIIFGLLFVNGCAINQLAAFLLYGSLAMGIPLYMTYMKMSHPGQPVFSHPIIWIIIICFLLYGAYYLLNSYRIRIPLSWLIVTYLVLGLGIGSSFVVNKVIKDYQRKRLVVFLNQS